MDEHLLYFPYYPGKSALWTGNFREGMIENVDELISYEYIMYEFTSAPKSYSLTGAEYAAYRYLPEETLARAQKHLEAAGVGSGMTISEIVALIEDYVQNSAEYSLQTEKMPENETDFALWFLEESDTGYCVHFASAAAVLLRAAGIPARYVTGYTVDAEKDTWVTVDSNKAHAWVEYKSAEGWTVLDATPSDEETPDYTEPPSTTEPPTEPSAPSTSVPPSETTEPGNLPTESTPGTTTPNNKPTDPGSVKKTDLSWIWKWLGYLTVAVGICGAVWGQFALRRGRRRRKMKTGHHNARALASWREILRYEKLLKLPAPESLLELAEKAKFSQHTLTDDELAEFDGYLKECREKLGEKPWILRSILRLVFAM
jgi:transglutaminase-like putative cysteine protease